ncbi:CHAT domain-containing tetratricopeptide repeat protein [Nostoc sp. UHCC 0302]|uniref:CHAT domain-containing protein n=1 Tax=Nostoc sp. UHCC 0302 TaxID=3134896 RepID=UPI00311CA42D
MTKRVKKSRQPCVKWTFWYLLPNISRYSLILLLSMVMLADTVGAKLSSAQLQIAQQPSTTQQDAIRAAAEKATNEGLELYKQGTAESLQQAIGKWQEALKLWQQVDDKRWEALTFIGIGRIYSSLGKKQEALKYYNQALPVLRAVGDRTGEATTLNNIGRIYSSLGEKQQALKYYNQALPILHAVGDRTGEATTLNSIGRIYSSLGKKQQALKYYNQALPILHAVGDRTGEATTLNNIGFVYDSLGEKQEALKYYNQALPILRAVEDRTREATTLNNIGFVYGSLGEQQQALKYYNQALSISRAVGDRTGEATTLNNIGFVYGSLGEQQQALKYYNQALPISRAVGDRTEEATTLNNIGFVYFSLGEKQEALKYYNQALPIKRAVGDRTGEATTLNNIGSVYDSLGEQQEALKYYNQALPILRAVGDRTVEATTLNNIGFVYDSLGEKQQALKYYNQVLPIRRAVGDRTGEATTLNNIGFVYGSLGEQQQALKYYNQALSISRAVGDRTGEATALNNIGFVYDSLGEKQQALKYYNQALPISRAVGDRTREAPTLSNIGFVYSSLGEKQQALKYYNQALPISRAVGDRTREAPTLSNIGFVYGSLGEKQQALKYYNQALPISRAVGDRTGEAITLNNIGSVYFSLGEKQQALKYYNQALPISRAVGDRTEEATTLSNIAGLERDRGNLPQALTQIEAAIKIIEDLRTKIINQQLRTSYFASVQGYYKFYIDLLMQLHKKDPSKGYDALALNASERSRARSLLELLTEARADIRQGVEPQLLAEERSLQQQIDARKESRIKLLSEKNTSEQVEKLNQEITELLDKYNQVLADIRAKSPRYAALTQPQPLNLEQIQSSVLDDNTILLQYSLGEEHSYLWLVTKTGMKSYELPKEADIATLAKQFYQNITQEKLDSRGGGILLNPGNSKTQITVATKLSQILLQPVARELGNKRLLIVADGILQYIPFAALPNPKQTKFQPLLVEHEIVNAPSASTIAVIRNEIKNRKVAVKKLAVLADPVFNKNDERFKSNIARGSQTTGKNSNFTDLDALAFKRSSSDLNLTFNRLKGTRTEAEKILSLVPESLSQSAFDFAANRATITSSQMSQYQIIHLATHGIFNTKHPEFSGIVLSLVDSAGNPQNGFLQLQDIFNLNLPAELVVLSACQTGLGEEVKGEGLVGLTRGFMYAGSPRVAVSLWSVGDVATSELMAKFYTKMLKENLRPAAALRAAQLEMWQNPKYTAPYFWAAFTLQGEWR